MSSIRAKMELTYTGQALPEVKFFGDLTPGDVRYARLAIQRAYALYILEQNNKARAKRLEAEEKRVEAETAEALNIEEANKKEVDNESGTIKSIKERSGNTETGSTRSRDTNRQGSGETVLAT